MNSDIVRSNGKRLASAGIGLAVVATLGACNSAGSVAPGQDGISTRLGNLLAFNSPNAPGAAPALAAQRIDCPVVQIEPGNAAFRSAGGDGAASVRYQISIGDVARECVRQGDLLAIRVGVETNIILGPAGSPGSYAAPLRVTVRRQSDEAVVASKVYRVGGAVGAAGSTQSTLVAEALTVPWINDRPDLDYEVVLGFGEGAAQAGRRARR